MRQVEFPIFAFALLVIAANTHALAANRSALVIGNDDYEQVTKLQKAANDARAVGETLEHIGFKVMRAENLSRREMNKQIQLFASKLEKGDEALFFFAGHGVEINGRNYLLPTDIPQAAPAQEGFVATEAIAVDRVLDRIRERGTSVSILVLDACRDNPFPKSGTRSLGGTRGLARMPAPEGTFIMYSAGVGQKALDSLGSDDPHTNSVFTRSLVPLLKEPGFSLTATARQVRRDVQALARTISHDQRPAYYDEVTGKFFFVRGTDPGVTPPQHVRSQDDILWASIEASKNSADFDFYLRQFPRGKFAALAKLRLERLNKVKPVSPVKSPPDSKPVREVSDLRGTWTCAGTATTKCAKMTCTANVVVSENLSKTRFVGRTRISCRTRARKRCRLPRGVKRQQKAEGVISGKVDGSRVRVTFVAEKPNADMSSISEYELTSDTLTYKRDLQGQSTNYRETCRWTGSNEASPVADRPR